MGSTLFVNANILSLNGNQDVFFGCLGVKGDSIVYLGKEKPKEDYDEVIDCEGNLLMPGFKDAHTHSGMSFARNYEDDLPLQNWLSDGVWPIERRIIPGDVYHLSLETILEYISGGITACFDQYFSPREMAKAAVDSGFRTVICGTAMVDYRDSVAKQLSFYKEMNGKNPLVRFAFGYHAEYTSSPEIMRDLSQIAHEYHLPVFSHNSETLKEVEGCQTRHNGLTPTEYADSFGLYDYGGGGFHCLYFSPHDMEIFKRHGCYIVANPGSNAKLASGIAPLEKYRQYGLNLALGTDGPGSNNGMDMFYEMRLSSVLQKLLNKDASSFGAKEALHMATVGGARAMGLNDADVLAVGKKADIIMINLASPSLSPRNDIVSSLVYSASKSDCVLTMIGGKILYRNGTYFLPVPPEKIIKDANEITRRLEDK